MSRRGPQSARPWDSNSVRVVAWAGTKMRGCRGLVHREGRRAAPAGFPESGSVIPVKVAG